MPRSKPTRTRQRNSGGRPPKLPSNPPKGGWWWVWETIEKNPIKSLAGTIGTILSIGSYIGGVFAQPEIILTGSDPNQLLLLPFVVKNNSSILTMTGANPLCRIESIFFVQKGSDKNLIMRLSSLTVAPKSIANFTCSIGVAVKSVAEAHLFVSVEYYTLGIWRRRSPEAEFTWLPEATPPHWIGGPFPERNRE